MTTLSQRAELRRQLEEAVNRLRHATSSSDRDTALSCLGIYVVSAQCEGVSVSELRQISGTYWPSIAPGARRN